MSSADTSSKVVSMAAPFKEETMHCWSPHREMNPETADIASWPTRKIIRYRVRELRRAADEIERMEEKIEAAAALIARKIHGGGRVITIGAGGSGVAGLSVMREIPQNHCDASPERFLYRVAGRERIFEPLGCEELEDSEEEGVRDIDALQVGERDVVIPISATGRTPYTRAAAKRARELGAYTIGLVGTLDGELNSEVHLCIVLDVGPEMFLGATCEKASSAQKGALDALMDVLVVCLGLTDGNLCRARLCHEKARIRHTFFAGDTG